MAQIHYYVHGRGRGHAARALAVIPALQEAGFEVDTFAGDDAMAMLGDRIPHVGVRSLRPDDGLALLPLLARRLWNAAAVLRQHRAALVISDGDLPSVLAAHLTGIPVLALGHGLIFWVCRRPRNVPALPWWREAVKAGVSSIGASAYLAVNFVPLVPRSARTRVVRPPVPADLQLVDPPGDRVLCYFRDDNGAAVLRALVAAGEQPLLFSRSQVAIPGVEVRALDRTGFTKALSEAKAVVASAGNQLLAECVALGMPLFALHEARDDEQRLNVAMLRAAGLGTGCAFDDVSPQRLRAFLAQARAGRGHRDARAWAAPTTAAAVVETARELLGRAPTA